MLQILSTVHRVRPLCRLVHCVDRLVGGVRARVALDVDTAAIQLHICRVFVVVAFFLLEIRQHDLVVN